MIFPFEYTLRLTTGENLEISEFDLNHVILTSNVKFHFQSVKELCTIVTRAEMEEAKGGYDDAFKKALKSPPIGCLLKNPNPICGRIDSCSMAKKSVCTTKNLSKKSGNSLPICWTVHPDRLDGLEKSHGTDLYDAVVHSWRNKRYAVIVEG